MLKALEQKGYLRRSRGQLDGRHLIVTITDEGYKLKEKGIDVEKWQEEVLRDDP